MDSDDDLEPAQKPAPVPPDPVPPPILSESHSTKRKILERNDIQQSAHTPNKKVASPDLSVPSIQTVYTDPFIVIGAIQSYNSTDKGPYVVHVSRTDTDQSAGTTIKTIQFGQFLQKNKFENIIPGGVKRVGRNKISVAFLSAKDANSFIISPTLSLYKLHAVIPTYNVTRMGLIRGVPTDLSMEEFAESVSNPVGAEVLKARRLNRKKIEDGKVSWVPTQSVVITFQGQILPARVFLFYNAIPVEIYQFPTIQCFSCCRYGHTKVQCRSKPRCFRCGQEHSGDSCDISETEASCLHCSEFVRSASKKTGGSTQNTNCKVKPKRRGWKVQDGHHVQAGHMLVTQRTTRFHPGLNVGFGKNGTLFAMEPGKVVVTCEKFEPNWDHTWVQRMYSGRTDQTILKKYYNIIPDPQHQRFKLIDEV